TIENVLARTANQHVVALTAEQSVIARSADQDVVAVTAIGGQLQAGRETGGLNDIVSAEAIDNETISCPEMRDRHILAEAVHGHDAVAVAADGDYVIALGGIDDDRVDINLRNVGI